MKQKETNYFKTNTLVFALTFVFLAYALPAQSSDPIKIYQEWRMLGESDKTIDVSAQVVSCDGANLVLLNVFNENVMDQTAKFSITIKNTDGAEVTKDIVVEVAKMQMSIAQCGDSATDKLKIALPDGYDAEKVILSVTFNN